VLVETFQSNVVEEGVSNPGSVVAVLDLPQLVGADFTHSDLVGLEVVLDGDLGGHPTHSGDLAPVKTESVFVYTKF